MTKFGDWIQEGGLHKLADRIHFTGRHDDEGRPGPDKCADTDCMTHRDLANLTAQLHGVAKGYMEWEADMVLDSDVWRSEDGLPHLTQHLQDKLMVLQKQRTAALAACKEFMEKYGD